MNRKIITKLLETKLKKGNHEPREDEIIDLIKLYKGSPFITKKHTVISPPKKVEVPNPNKRESLIEIEGWDT